MYDICVKCTLFICSVNSIHDLLIDLPVLVKKLQNVREKHMQYSQYLTARENLKNLFSVPESVEKTKQWINEGKLLYAHHVCKFFFGRIDCHSQHLYINLFLDLI